MRTGAYFFMPPSDGGNPLLIKKYRYQPNTEQEDPNSFNPRNDGRFGTIKKRSMNDSHDASPKSNKPVLPLKFTSPKPPEHGMLGTLFRASQERQQKLNFLVPSNKRAFTPVLRTSVNLNSTFQTPTQTNSIRGKNPKLWSSNDNPYRYKIYKPLTPLRNDRTIVIPSYPGYAKKKFTGETPKNETQSSLPYSVENSDTISNPKKLYKLPKRIIPELEGIPQQTRQNKSKLPPTSYLLNRSLDLRSSQQKTNLQNKNRTGIPSESDNKAEKALRLSQNNFKRWGIVNRSIDAGSKERAKSKRRRSQQGAPLDLGNRVRKSNDEKRLRSSSSNRSKSSNRSLSHTSGFYNYDSEERDVGSCKNSKTKLKYSLDEIDPPSDEELSFLETFKGFYEKKIGNPQRAKSYLNESIALKNELHDMIDSESSKFKQKLEDSPQSRKPIMVLPIEKQPEEIRYLGTYGAALL